MLGADWCFLDSVSFLLPLFLYNNNQILPLFLYNNPLSIKQCDLWIIERILSASKSLKITKNTKKILMVIPRLYTKFSELYCILTDGA